MIQIVVLNKRHDKWVINNMMLKILFACVVCLPYVSCFTVKSVNFNESNVKTDPAKFFVGNTMSYGVSETRNGKPASEITTQTTGTVKDGIVCIEQDLFPGNGEKNHRSWQLKQIDAEHYEATANDIEGVAKGKLTGNYFTWTFRLKVNRGLIKHVSMSQHMYLMPDGKTMIIRSVIRKFGIIVREITEQFKKV